MSIRSKIQALITAANATTGESDTTLTEAVQTLVDGYGQGGGGSGYAKKTGSFVLASDYTYSNSVASGYSGSLLVDTGLTNIDFVALWVEEWIEQTMGDATGAGIYIAMNKAAGIQKDSAASPSYYIPAVGALKNNATNYYFGDTYGGIVTHNVCPNDVPVGSFGFRCRSGAYGIKAGYTVRWEAYGAE